MVRVSIDRPGLIYGVRDIRTGKIRYVGQTVQGLPRREKQHRRDTPKGKTPFGKWMRVNSEFASFEMLQDCADRSSLNLAEREWIRVLRLSNEADLNLEDGGIGARRFAGVKNRKLTSEQVSEIRTLRQQGWESLISIGNRYGVSEAVVSKVLTNSTYFDPAYDPASLAGGSTGRFPPGYTGGSRQTITREQVNSIRTRRAKSWESPSALALEYGVKVSTIEKILSNHNWHDPNFDVKTIKSRPGMPLL